nr:hypothetical protein CFP56_67774 [Quercus suber]
MVAEESRLVREGVELSAHALSSELRDNKSEEGLNIGCSSSTDRYNQYHADRRKKVPSVPKPANRDIH